jgi:hypothetical protein
MVALNFKYPINPIKRPVDRMNSVAMFVLLSLTLITATIVFAIPIHVLAQISYCVSGKDIFQCFIKQNDCETFAEAHPGTKCLRTKS